ncbi:TPA: phage tail protein [Vibrio cholerae]
MTNLVPESEQQYGSILTVLGENAEQNGKLLNKQIVFTHIAFGDANDTYVQPDRKAQGLVNELYRIPVNSVDVLQATPDSVPILKVEAILPDNVNDVVIREFAAVATFNGQSYFHAIGNCARVYVPRPINNGNVSNPVTLEMTFVITSAEPIVEIDPTVITASREWVQQKAKIKAEETTQGRTLPDRFAHEIDVRDFGAHDLLLNNAEQFQAAFNKARELNKPVKAKGRFVLKDALLQLYTEADFSGAIFVIDKAAIQVLDRRDENEFVRVFYESEITGKHLMTDGRGSLRGILSDSVLDEFENSYVWITSDTLHQYRINGSDVSEYKQGSVSVLRRHGQLDYTLTHDYTQSSNVRIELRKMPKNKLSIKCPEIEIIRLAYSYVWTIRRSLTNVLSPSIMTKQSEMIIDDGYRALINIDGCANIKVDDMDTAGLGEPSGIDGVTSVVRYDLIYGRVAGLTINNPNCGTGWKSIDGNYSRGISVRGGTIAGIHGHFGVADVTVDDVTITCAALSFATGANDSTIRLTNIRYQGAHSKLFALRSDFSELRGRVILDGIDINADKIGDSTFDVVDLYESAVKSSGGDNPKQPRTLYMPRSIECKNIAINHKTHVRLINMPDYDYGPDKPLKMPRRIKFSDIDIENVKGRTEFFFNTRPFDKDTTQPIILELKDFIQKRKLQPILLSIGRINSVDGMPYDFRLNNVEVTTNFYDEKAGYIGGNYRSRIVAHNTRIYRGWDMFDGNVGTGKVMYLEWNSCTYNPIDTVGEAQFSLGSIATAKIINSTFNGSDFLATVGRLTKVGQSVNEQGNNTFIDYDAADSINNNQSWGKTNALGKMFLLGSAKGHKGNYSRQADGSLLPTWDTSRDIVMIGTHWMWFDDSGSMRVHDNYPVDFNADGRKVQFAA